MSFDIIPSIVTSEPPKLKEQIRQIEAMADQAQVDFMDGQFVPLQSVSPFDLTQTKSSLTLIAHLMVVQPETYLEPLAQAGIEKVIFHFESTTEPLNLIEKIRDKKMGVGIAIKLGTPTRVLESLASQVDFVVFLAVKPRAFGSPFQPEVFKKIAEFRQTQPKIRVGVDGGIRLENIRFVKDHGVDEVYTGTAIFARGDPLKNFQALKKTAGND